MPAIRSYLHCVPDDLPVRYSLPLFCLREMSPYQIASDCLGKVDVNAQEEIGTVAISYLATLVKRNEGVIRACKDKFYTWFVLSYQFCYAIGKIQSKVLLQYIFQASTLVLTAMSCIQDPHQRVQLTGKTGYRKDKQQKKQWNTFHDAKLVENGCLYKQRGLIFIYPESVNSVMKKSQSVADTVSVRRHSSTNRLKLQYQLT